MGEEYVSSGESAPEDDPLTKDPEGDIADPASMAFKFDQYKKRLE
jgi:hypothetical protein